MNEPGNVKEDQMVKSSSLSNITLMTRQDHYFTAQFLLYLVVFKADIFILSVVIPLLPVLFIFGVQIFTVNIKIILKLEYMEICVCVCACMHVCV